VVLAFVLGLAIQTWMSVPGAAVDGLLIGMLVALLVPTGKDSCPIPR
jgi:hypothetical protein